LTSISAKDKNEKKLLGFSFFFLMEADETTIKDGGHVLCLYKCEDPAKLQVSIFYNKFPIFILKVIL
jgi:dedicator of cytokinesis protein 3